MHRALAQQGVAGLRCCLGLDRGLLAGPLALVLALVLALALNLGSGVVLGFGLDSELRWQSRGSV